MAEKKRTKTEKTKRQQSLVFSSSFFLINQSASGLHRSNRLVAEIAGGAGGVAAARAEAAAALPSPPPSAEATGAALASFPRPPLRTAYRIALESVAKLPPWPCSRAWTSAKARSPPRGGEGGGAAAGGGGAAAAAVVAPVPSSSSGSAAASFLLAGVALLRGCSQHPEISTTSPPPVEAAAEEEEGATGAVAAVEEEGAAATPLALSQHGQPSGLCPAEAGRPRPNPLAQLPDPSPAASTSTRSLAPAGKGSTSAALRSAEEIAAAEDAPAAAAAAAAVLPRKSEAAAEEVEAEEGCASARAAALAASHGSKVAATRGREEEEEESLASFRGEEEAAAFVASSLAEEGRRKKDAALLLLAVSLLLLSFLFPEGEAEVAESSSSLSCPPFAETMLLLSAAASFSPSGLPRASPPRPKNAKTRLSPGRAPETSHRAEAMMLLLEGSRRRSCGFGSGRGGEEDEGAGGVFPSSDSTSPLLPPSWRKIVSSRENPNALAIALRTHSASLTAPGKPRAPDPTATKTARRREGLQELSSFCCLETGAEVEVEVEV